MLRPVSDHRSGGNESSHPFYYKDVIMPKKKKAKEKESKGIVFAPGCFDEFEGTQEELDALVLEIKAAFEEGGMFENAVPIDEVTDTDILEEFDRYMNEAGSKRRLH